MLVITIKEILPFCRIRKLEFRVGVFFHLLLFAVFGKEEV